jgi:stearoyl-CoA desaturase (delta-9 desaturase)
VNKTPKTHEEQPTRTALTAKMVTLALLVLPFLALAAAVATFGPPSGRSIATGLLIGWVSLHGIAIGYHRYLTHRSFETGRGTRAVLTVLGAASAQGGPLHWVATHRVHHRNTDTEKDPHSPLTAKGSLRGMLHAQFGWLMNPPDIDPRAICPELVADPVIRRIDRLWPVIAVFSVALLPAGIGWIGGGVNGAVETLLWAGVVRMGLFHHITWSVNSVGHLWGKRPFATKDGSRNVAFLAPLTCGEGWHNNHHAHPRAARHGMLPGQIDTAARTIWVMEKLGLATKVRWPDARTLQTVGRA